MSVQTFSLITDTRELTDLARDLGMVPGDMLQMAEEAITQTAMFTLAFAKAGAPRLTSHLANNITLTPPSAQIRGGGISFVASVQTNSPPYDMVQEFGRTPGQRQPPIAAMERWVRIKVARGQFRLPTTGKRGSKKSQIRQAAYRVAQSIARKGTVGRSYMRTARVFAERDLAIRIKAGIDRVYNRWFRSL
jgi:hypothetical protein